LGAFFAVFRSTVLGNFGSLIGERSARGVGIRQTAGIEEGRENGTIRQRS
jgi:hypothetical protein